MTVAAYADDVTLFLRDTASLDGILPTFARYEEISGGRQNLLK